MWRDDYHVYPETQVHEGRIVDGDFIKLVSPRQIKALADYPCAYLWEARLLPYASFTADVELPSGDGVVLVEDGDDGHKSCRAQAKEEAALWVKDNLEFFAKTEEEQAEALAKRNAARDAIAAAKDMTLEEAIAAGEITEKE